MKKNYEGEKMRKEHMSRARSEFELGWRWRQWCAQACQEEWIVPLIDLKVVQETEMLQFLTIILKEE